MPFAEEAQARTEQDEGGQGELQIPARPVPERAHHPIVDRRDEVRAHFEDEDGQREERREQQRALQAGNLGLASRPLVVGHGAGLGAASAP